MAGKIVADQIEHSTAGSLDTKFVVNGSAKAWVHFSTHDNPPNLDGSFGVSTLTDNSSEVEVNLTTAMSDLFFCPVAGGGGSANAPNSNPSNRSLAVCVESTTKVDSEVYTTANTFSTCQCHIAVLGDLA